MMVRDTYRDSYGKLLEQKKMQCECCNDVLLDGDKYIVLDSKDFCQYCMASMPMEVMRIVGVEPRVYRDESV